MTRKVKLLLRGVTMIGVLVGVSLLGAQEKDHPDGIVALAGSQGWLGVTLMDVTSDKVRDMKLPGEYGAIVTEVEADSPAAKAGLEKNDVIVEFAGEQVRSVAHLRRLLRETPPQRTISIQFIRAGQTRNSEVVLRARQGAPFEGVIAPSIRIPPIPPIRIPELNFNFMSAPRLGISADNLTPQLAEYFGVKQGKGVLVREVMSGSAAEKAGLKAGDCIVRLESTEVGSVDDLRRALATLAEEHPEGKRQVNLTIVRDRHEQTVKAELEPRRDHFRRYTAEDERVQYDPEELQRLSAEVESQASEIARAHLEAQKLTQELRQAARRWQTELKAQASQAQREAQKLQREFEEQLKPQLQELQKELQQKLRKLGNEIGTDVV